MHGISEVEKDGRRCEYVMEDTTNKRGGTKRGGKGGQSVTCDVKSTSVGNGQTQRATSTRASARASKARTRIRDRAGTVIAPIVMVLLQ